MTRIRRRQMLYPTVMVGIAVMTVVVVMAISPSHAHGLAGQTAHKVQVKHSKQPAGCQSLPGANGCFDIQSRQHQTRYVLRTGVFDGHTNQMPPAYQHCGKHDCGSINFQPHHSGVISVHLTKHTRVLKAEMTLLYLTPRGKMMEYVPLSGFRHQRNIQLDQYTLSGHTRTSSWMSRPKLATAQFVFQDKQHPTPSAD